MNAWNINVSINYKEMLNTHLSQLILLSIDIYIAPISYKKKSSTKQNRRELGSNPDPKNSKAKSLSNAPQS